jgi:hypothetical protein
MGLSVDEHRILSDRSRLEARAALEELTKLGGIHVDPDATPALYAFLKAPESATAKLARFVAEIDTYRKVELEEDLENGLRFQRRIEGEAAAFKARREQDLARAEQVRLLPRPPGSFPPGYVPGTQRRVIPL